MGRFIESLARRKIGKAGMRAERDTCNRLQAKPVPGSGARAGQGDAKVGECFVENKSTVGNSFRLTRNLLLRTLRRARMHGQWPALTVQFTDDDGKARTNETWVVLPEKEFRRLTGIDL